MTSTLAEGALVAGRYRVGREIGRGGMGAVYEATDEKLAQRVALKIASPRGEGDAAGFRARFRREAELGGRLGRIPGVVRALDWGPLGEDGTLFLVMDLVPGARPLDLDGGPREARVARVREAADLVAAVHRERVVHRDLKPANLLHAADGKVQLTDFGLAKLLGSAGSRPPTRSRCRGAPT